MTSTLSDTAAAMPLVMWGRLGIAGGGWASRRRVLKRSARRAGGGAAGGSGGEHQALRRGHC